MPSIRGHGQRAAEFAAGTAAGNLVVRSLLDDRDLDLLRRACAEHTNAQTEAELTVQVCWDADRLDLGRIAIRPDPQRLCTPAARQPEILEWAYRRSRNR